MKYISVDLAPGIWGILHGENLLLSNSDFLFLINQTVQSAGVLLQSPFPGVRHGQKQVVETRFVKTLADIRTGRHDDQILALQRFAHVIQGFFGLPCAKGAGERDDIWGFLIYYCGKPLNMRDPQGEHQAVAAFIVALQNVFFDLLVPEFILADVGGQFSVVIRTLRSKGLCKEVKRGMT